MVHTMQEEFSRIRDAYTRRRSRLLLSGKFQRPTSHGYWAQSNPDHVFGLFRKLDLQTYKGFLDLGSGDGLVVAVASLFTDATGIEVDARLHRDAEDMREKLGLAFMLKNSDYILEDLSQYDFIFIAPDNYFHRIEKRLVEDFRGTLVVLDNMFRPLTLSPSKNVSVKGTCFSVYEI